MRDRDLYAQFLGITSPWHVSDVRLDVPAGKVEVIVEHRGQACCPQCGKPCPGYDLRLRRWRHLDTCQLQTVMVAEVPRVECPDHGVVQASTPWAEAGSRFTALPSRRSNLSDTVPVEENGDGSGGSGDSRSDGCLSVCLCTLGSVPSDDDVAP